MIIPGDFSFSNFPTPFYAVLNTSLIFLTSDCFNTNIEDITMIILNNAMDTPVSMRILQIGIVKVLGTLKPIKFSIALFKAHADNIPLRLIIAPNVKRTNPSLN